MCLSTGLAEGVPGYRSGVSNGTWTAKYTAPAPTVLILYLKFVPSGTLETWVGLDHCRQRGKYYNNFPTTD